MSTLALAFTKIFVADLDATTRFYRDAIGLELVTQLAAGDGEDALKESILSVGGGNSNQLILVSYDHRPAPTPGEACTGLIVLNMETTLTAIEKFGGKILVPIQEIPKHGVRAGIIADPEGHMIELVQMLGTG